MKHGFHDMKACQKRFLTHLVDAALHIRQSPSNRFDMAYRASVISTVLTLESAANSCIHNLALPGALFDEVERFSIIGKYDYFLFHIKQRHLNRGDTHVQRIAEIISLRNDAFHAKIRPGSFVPDGSAQFGTTKMTHIPYDIRSWDRTVAMQVLRATVDFYNWYFIEQCALRKSTITTMLTCYEEQLSKEQVLTWIAVDAQILSAIREAISNPINFIDLRPQPCLPGDA
jgi:hypothetical protein